MVSFLKNISTHNPRILVKMKAKPDFTTPLQEYLDKEGMTFNNSECFLFFEMFNPGPKHNPNLDLKADPDLKLTLNPNPNPNPDPHRHANLARLQ